MIQSPTVDQIKTTRQSLGLTQSAAARLIYVKPSAWAHWERGKTPMHRAFWELFLIKSGLWEVDLTPKQERFAQLVTGGATYSDAYRGAYDAENMADSTIWSRASELAADGKVSGRITALKESAAIDALWSLVMSIKTKLRALKIAIKKGDSRAIIQASESLDKLCGFEPARKVDITSSDGSMSPNKRRPFEDLTDEELDEELARRGLKRADIGL